MSVELTRTVPVMVEGTGAEPMPIVCSKPLAGVVSEFRSSWG